MSNDTKNTNTTELSDQAVPQEPVDISENRHGVGNIVQLPSQLVNYRSKNILFSFFLIAAGIGFSLYSKSFSPIILFSIFALFFIWRGISVLKRFEEGKIAEIAATCTGLNPSFYKDRITVTFAAEDTDDQYAYYKFVVPNKLLAEDFIVGAMYFIYFDRDNPHALIGYVQVNPGVSA